MRQLLILLGLASLLAGCAAGESAHKSTYDLPWVRQPAPSTYSHPSSVDVYIHRGSGWGW
jgi:uncharacterized lipoprotein YmbA